MQAPLLRHYRQNIKYHLHHQSKQFVAAHRLQHSIEQ